MVVAVATWRESLLLLLGVCLSIVLRFDVEAKAELVDYGPVRCV
jgi:hypothetical protein